MDILLFVIIYHTIYLYTTMCDTSGPACLGTQKKYNCPNAFAGNNAKTGLRSAVFGRTKIIINGRVFHLKPNIFQGLKIHLLLSSQMCLCVTTVNHI